MTQQSTSLPRIAAIIPCYNEALAIGRTLDEFRQALPEAMLYVFDNNSTDDTARVAREHGATVVHVALRGKGNVVRRMFADLEADIYIMVDGDGTYDLSSAPSHIGMMFERGLDMIVGNRVDDGSNPETYRPGHRLGNYLLTSTVAWLFGRGQFSDMLSGYRVFSRRYVKSFPATSKGFETETELTVHALELRMPIEELPVVYRSRPDGSHSKLSTYGDGWRILKTIAKLLVSERPLAFFLVVAAVLALVSIALVVPIAITYMHTGLVPRLPTAVLSTGLMLAAMLSAVCGAVLNTVTIGRQEVKRMFYLAQQPPGARS